MEEISEQSSKYGVTIDILIFRPSAENNKKCVVQLVHGLSEYCGVYKEMGEYFAKWGYTFVVHDVIGHGDSSVDGRYMYMESGDWKYAVKDLDVAYSTLSTEEQGYRRVLIGFSLGSFVVRCYMNNPVNKVDDVILVGTGNKSGIEVGIGKLICNYEIMRLGEYFKSDTVMELAFTSNNKKWAGNGTLDAWLYADGECRERYSNDIRIHHFVLPTMFRELLRGMGEAKKADKHMHNCKRLLLLSGSEDVVTGDLSKVAKYFDKLGCKNLWYNSFEGYRHAILNDGCRYDVWEFIIGWLSEGN